MKRELTPPDLTRRLQDLEKAIAQNERRQRRLQRAVARGKPSPDAPLRSAPSTPPPPAKDGCDRPVRFTQDNASIFMSGNLEELDVRHVTPTERRNRFLLLLAFLAAILLGIVYMMRP